MVNGSYVDREHSVLDILHKDDTHDSDVDSEHHIDDIAQKDDSDVDIEHHDDGILQRDYSNVDINHRINDILQKDDENAFVAFVNSQLRRPGDETYRILHPYKLLARICYHGAAKCGDALLKGKTGHTVNIDIRLMGTDKLYPIHYAALILSPMLTRLFVKNGASADVIGYDADLKIYGLLPVNIAVEALSKQIDWTPEESIIKLVLTFFSNMKKLKEPLETISLLAGGCNIMDVMLRYAEEVKFIELATLLLVAPPSVCGLYSTRYSPEDDPDHGMTVRICVAREIASLLNKEYSIMGQSKRLALALKEKKEKLMSLMLLIEIFSRNGRRIEVLRTAAHNLEIDCIVGDVAFLLHSSGIPFRGGDVQYLGKYRVLTRYGYTFGNEKQEQEQKQKQKHRQKHTTGGLHREAAHLREVTQFPMLNPLMISQLVRTYHTSRSLRVSKKFCTTVQPQVSHATKAVESCVPPLLNKLWPSFVCTIRRAINFI